MHLEEIDYYRCDSVSINFAQANSMKHKFKCSLESFSRNLGPESGKLPGYTAFVERCFKNILSTACYGSILVFKWGI